VPVDWGIPERKLDMGVAEKLVRPLGDVPARGPVSVSLIATFYTSEVDIAFPVLFAYVSTPRTGLACIAGLNFDNHYSFPLSNMLQSVSEEAIRDAVNLPSALLAPFALTLSEIFKPFNSDVAVEFFSELHDFVSYLPHPRSDVVSLFSAEFFKFKSCFPFGNGVSIFLEFCSAFLEPELSCRNVLSKVCLLENLVFANHGYGDFGAIDVYAHPVGSNRGFWRFLLEDDEKPEVSLHNDAGCYPAFLEMFLEASVGSISAYRKPYSFVVGSKANYWVLTFGFTKAEESPIEAYNTLVYLVVYGFSVVPGVEDGFQDQLGCNIISASEVLIVLALELRPLLSSPSQRQQLLNHTEERTVSLLQQSLLSLCRLKKIQRQTLLHPATPNGKIETEDFKVFSNSSPLSRMGTPWRHIVEILK